MEFINIDADKSCLRITADRRITVATDRHVRLHRRLHSRWRQLAMNFDTNAIDAKHCSAALSSEAVLDGGTTIPTERWR